jgi:hypothetical protein
MHGFVSKNDRKEKIIIISECISDGRKKKFQVGSKKKKRCSIKL